MSERVVFPLLTGQNSPAYVLEALRTLLALGVPEENLRLLPRLGHFAVPEICEQDPPGPAYDPKTGRVTVHPVVPADLRPRLTVSVRGETVMRFWEGADGEPRHEARTVGRLAHFLPPLMAGIPGMEPDNAASAEDPLDRLTRHVGAMYPELLATLSPETQEDLMLVSDEMMALLGDDAGEDRRRGQYAAQALQHVAEAGARAACRAAFPLMADKVPASGVPGLDDREQSPARTRFRRWSGLLLSPEAEAGRLEQEAAELSPAERTQQHTLWRAFQTAVSFETLGERRRIVQELMEILTTEAFLAVGALDAMNGIAWIHGPLSDICLPTNATTPDGLLLSVTGGRHSRGLLLTLLQTWAQSPDGALGVGGSAGPDGEDTEGKPAPHPECLSLAALDETERLELLSLALWRRECGDVRAVLETAAQRLLHPETQVLWQRYQPSPGRFGSLLAQPGQTAVLGGPALLQFPGLTIRVPLAEDADDASVRAKAVLQILQRLFVPVSCRVEVVWQETVARLSGGSYLQHDFQQGVRLADASAAPTRTGDDE